MPKIDQKIKIKFTFEICCDVRVKKRQYISILLTKCNLIDLMDRLSTILKVQIAFIS